MRDSLLGAAALLCALASVPAYADVRVWENGQDDLSTHRWLDVTGFVQPGYVLRQDDANNNANTSDGFVVQRARLGVRAQVQEWLRLRIEIETTPNTALTDAYADFVFHPALTLRVGQFQLAFLRTFQFGESQLGFIDRVTYVPSSPDREFLRYLKPRDIGVMATGRVGDTSPDARSPVLEYAVGAFMGQGGNQPFDPKPGLLLSARLELHVLGVPRGLGAESDLARNPHPHVAAAAGVYTNCDDRDQFNRGFTTDAELRWRGLYANASFVWFTNGPVTDGNGLGNALGYGGDDSCGGTTSDVPEHRAWGASGQVQYVLPRALFPVDAQALELLARVDWVDPYSQPDGFLGADEPHGAEPVPPAWAPPEGFNVSDNPPTQWRLTFGVNWFPTGAQSLRLSFNYQHRREAENVISPSGTFQGVDNEIAWLQLTAGL